MVSEERNGLLYEKRGRVLILVLVDNGFWDDKSDAMIDYFDVLILVLVDNGFWATIIFAIIIHFYCLNPCFSG